MRAFLRWTATIVMIAAAALVAGTLLPRPLFATAVGGEIRTLRILVLSSPIHTDIAVPVDEVKGADFAFLKDAKLPLDNPNARWVLFGWGGKAFYVATPALTDIRVGPLLKSFTLDSSVMHIQVAGTIDEQRPGIATFPVSQEAVRRLLAFARSSFAQKDGAPIHLEGTGYGPDDTFFEALGSFNALIGCNTWTAAALREVGLRTGWWNPLPQTLLVSLAVYD